MLVLSPYWCIDIPGVFLDPAVSRGSISRREAWSKSYNINVIGTHILTEDLMPMLFKSASPHIIFVSSTVGSFADHVSEKGPIHQPLPSGWPKRALLQANAYKSSKSGMNMMAREWCRMLKNDNVKIHIISPGPMATRLGDLDINLVKKMGAKDPLIGGEYVRDVIEGKFDADQGRLTRMGEGVVGW
jgi:NAD(P)-dependent dehydrogenase (short-subunit alcohol dehydrogenase family)